MNVNSKIGAKAQKVQTMEKISTYIHTWATAEIKADHSDQVECRRSFERSATSASACNMLESSFGRQARFRKEMRN